MHSVQWYWTDAEATISAIKRMSLENFLNMRVFSFRSLEAIFRNVKMLRELKLCIQRSCICRKNVKHSSNHMMQIYVQNIEKFTIFFHWFGVYELAYIFTHSPIFGSFPLHFTHFVIFFILFLEVCAFQMHTSQNDMFMWCDVLVSRQCIF